MRPHPFIPGDVPDWTGAHETCASCELPRGNAIHDYEPPDDDTARILGEGEDAA